jgi:hypothetical protein
MKLESSFLVPAPPAAAWRLLNDVPRVVPCMPGAELVDVVAEDRWRATLHVKLGPIALVFSVDVTRNEADEEAQRVTLSARAREVRGRGGASATIESTLQEAPGGGTQVSITTDLSLQGAVAQYGRGVVADVAAQLTTQFADCLAKKLADPDGGAPTAAEVGSEVKPAGGLRLVLPALWRSLRRLLRGR